MAELAATLDAARRPRPAWRSDRVFFTAMSVLLAAVVFAGFAPTYYLRSVYRAEPLARVFQVHGAIFTAWMLLLVVQTSLVAGRRVDLHRKLGVAGAVLAVLMLVAGYEAAMTAARHGFSVPGLPPPLIFLAVPLFDLVVFAALVGAALLLRRSPAAHKRLMLLATVAIVPAAIARLPHLLQYGPLMFFGLGDLFVVACLVYDRLSRGAMHPATIWGGLFLLVSQVGRLAVSGTDAWMAFARWLTGA
jgi:hypothetical protein